MERALIITARTVPVITVKIIIIIKMLAVLEHKKSGKNGYYKLY